MSSRSQNGCKDYDWKYLDIIEEEQFGCGLGIVEQAGSDTHMVKRYSGTTMCLRNALGKGLYPSCCYPGMSVGI